MNEWTKMSLEDVKKRVIAAICSLYRYDRELLEADANERGVRCVISSSARFYFSTPWPLPGIPPGFLRRSQ